MSYIKSYRELIVWQKGTKLVKEIFLLTGKFPKSETYGIVSQMRRAAVSIPSNIVEGYGRRSAKDYARFYAIAYGSTLELETQITLSRDLELAGQDDFISSEILLKEVARMLNSMTSKMKKMNSGN